MSTLRIEHELAFCANCEHMGEHWRDVYESVYSDWMCSLCNPRIGKSPLKPRRGRREVADKRVLRGCRFNDAEWTEVKRKAAEAGVGVAAWVRKVVVEA